MTTTSTRKAAAAALPATRQEILAEIPEYAQAHAALQRIKAMPPVPNYADPKDALSTFVLDAAVTGQALPDLEELQALARQALVGPQAGVLIRSSLDSAKSQLEGELEQLTRANEAAIHRGLDAALQQLISEASDLRNCVGLLDAETVLRSRRADDYERFSTLARRYYSLRREQRQMDKLMDGPSLLHVGIQAVVRDVEKAWPDYGRPIAVRKAYSGIVHEDRTLPWPHTPGHELRLVDAETPGFFAWALDSGAHLWIPTRAERAAEATRLRKLRAERSEQAAERSRTR